MTRCVTITDTNWTGYNRRIGADRCCDFYLVLLGGASSAALLVYRLTESDEDVLVVAMLQAGMALSTLRMLVLLPEVNSLVYSLLITLKSLKVTGNAWIKPAPLMINSLCSLDRLAVRRCMLLWLRWRCIFSLYLRSIASSIIHPSLIPCWVRSSQCINC